MANGKFVGSFINGPLNVVGGHKKVVYITAKIGKQEITTYLHTYSEDTSIGLVDCCTIIISKYISVHVH